MRFILKLGINVHYSISTPDPDGVSPTGRISLRFGLQHCFIDFQHFLTKKYFT